MRVRRRAGRNLFREAPPPRVRRYPAVCKGAVLVRGREQPIHRASGAFAERATRLDGVDGFVHEAVGVGTGLGF